MYVPDIRQMYLRNCIKPIRIGMVRFFFSYKLILYFRYKHLVDEGEERIQIPLKVGHHRCTSKTPFKWRFAGRLMLAQH